MVIIGLMGPSGVGKDTVADILVEHHGFAKIAFADALKSLLIEIDPILENGWPLSKHMKNSSLDEIKRYSREFRRLMQDTGHGLRKMDKLFWIRCVDDAIESLPSKHIVITDIRYGNEYDYVIKQGGKVYEVVRPNNDMAIPANHPTERFKAPVSEVITNDGDLAHLKNAVENVIKM